MDDRDDEDDDPCVLQFLVSVPVPEDVDAETVAAIEGALSVAVWDKTGGWADRAEPFVAANPNLTVRPAGELRRGTTIG